MTLESAILSLILLGAVLLFAFDVFPVDKVSILILAALLLTRLISPEEAVSGFGNTATITVACMLALSFGIQRSGGLNFIANKIIDLAAGSESKVLASLILSVGLLSAFINNTAAVALFLPLTLALAREQKLNPSKLLMPMSFAAMFAGMCTLIGTSTNLLVYSLVMESLDWRIGMFEFTKAGIVFFLVGSAYLVIFGRRLLPERRAPENLTEDYKLRNFFTELVVLPDSKLVGQTPLETRFGELFDLEIIEIIRDKRKLLPDSEEDHLREGDIILVRGDPKQLVEIQQEQGVQLRAHPVTDRELEDENIILVEAFISPSSRLIERTLKEVDFRRTYQSTALAIRSHGRTIREKIGKTPLEFGDSLLIVTTTDHLGILRDSPDFMVLEEVRFARLRKNKVVLSVGTFAGIVIAAALGVTSVTEAAIIGVGIMILTGCLRLKELYSHMSWQTLIMLGCLIPLGHAMENTGLASLAANAMVDLLESLGPTAILSGLYLMTTLLTSIMSNNATAVLLVPVSISVAAQLQVDPKPLIIAVMFAASSSFLTPVGYQTNLFVFGPGGYRFSDFFRVGAFLNLLFWGLATLLIPFFWPF